MMTMFSVLVHMKMIDDRLTSNGLSLRSKTLTEYVLRKTSAWIFWIAFDLNDKCSMWWILLNAKDFNSVKWRLDSIRKCFNRVKCRNPCAWMTFNPVLIIDNVSRLGRPLTRKKEKCEVDRKTRIDDLLESHQFWLLLTMKQKLNRNDELIEWTKLNCDWSNAMIAVNQLMLLNNYSRLSADENKCNEKVFWTDADNCCSSMILFERTNANGWKWANKSKWKMNYERNVKKKHGQEFRIDTRENRKTSFFFLLLEKKNEISMDLRHQWWNGNCSRWLKRIRTVTIDRHLAHLIFGDFPQRSLSEDEHFVLQSNDDDQIKIRNEEKTETL